jgi:hypothetical protein
LRFAALSPRFVKLSHNAVPNCYTARLSTRPSLSCHDRCITCSFNYYANAYFYRVNAYFYRVNAYFDA